MPRAGLTRDDVVAAAAELADESGYHELTMGLLAERLGVRAPSLYKHVDSLADLQHRIATLAVTELGNAVGEALQGRAGLDALTGLLSATRAYVTAHPGRYTATIGAEFTGPDDPLLAANTRLIKSIAAVLRGYGVGDGQIVHAIRTIRCTLHGFAVLQAAHGFQWSGDPEETFDWMTRFIDGGLRAVPAPAKG
ncbi:MAG TPA: TetR/AcrR family transcriptional regulator [Streptosporangiaceae bacterium]|nr:TetR/AcrR family transcriptional regulator [Streptosporangiaceae bacterium]